MSTSRIDQTTERIISGALSESKRLEKSGRLEQALEQLEKVLSDADNETIPSARKVVKRIATLCNRLATGGSSGKVTVRYLRTAEQVLQSTYLRSEHDLDEGCFRLTILTFNNWATYHKEKTSYHMALSYLLRAMRMIERVGEVRNPDTLELCAKTKLNVAALYSELRRYPEAVEYAEQCLATLQLELNLRLSGRKMEELKDKERLKFINMIGTYVVAFYNIGVSEESQGHRSNATEAYRNAVSIGKRYLPSSNSVLALAQSALSDTPPEAQSEIKSSPRDSNKPLPEDHKIDVQEVVDEPEQLQDTSSRLLSPLSSNNISAIRQDSVEDLPREPAEKLRDDQYKYYTPEQLQKLQQRLSKGTGLNFVSADKYFYTKITKTLNVSQDVKFLRPLSA